jgi:hypothetical protein
MRHAVTGIKLVFCLALLSAGPAFTQSPSDEEISKPTAASAPVAHVYVQTTQGVNVYDLAAAGKLTLVEGSPFATTGLMAGSNGRYFVSIGTNYIHIYNVESDGAIGKQASEMNTQDYSGAACGTTDGNGGTLGHTGKYLYVQLYGATYEFGGEQYTLCSAWQSYKIGSDGGLSFLGDTVSQNGVHGNAFWIGLSTISGNDKFAFGSIDEVYAPVFSAFEQNTDGALDANGSFTEIDPLPNPNPPNSDNRYFPISMTADPTGHMAVLMEEAMCSCNPPSPQLASYTIDSSGNIRSTNTWLDMPTPDFSPYQVSVMSMSPSGRLLALAGQGLQIFHFNGASPITKYSNLLLPNVGFYQLAWDKANHLYALSYSSGELYVYTVTPTSIGEVAGSPYRVQNAYGIKSLIVVPKL